MTSPLYVMQVPVISTAHLPNDEAVNEAECLSAVYDGGWFVFMGDDEDDTMPEWYRAVRRWAQPRDYFWVRFDSHGDVVEGLAQYVW